MLDNEMSLSSLLNYRDTEIHPMEHDTLKTSDENQLLVTYLEEDQTQSETGDEADDEVRVRKKLNDRIKVVEDLISSLEEQISEEVKLWRKERDEYKVALLRKRGDICCWCDLEETTAAARAAAQAYAEELLHSNIKFINDSGVDVEMNETKIFPEYRQDSLALSSLEEERDNMQDLRLIASTYHQSLVEVERLCNEELENVEKSFNELQPLREMICQWSLRENNNSTKIAIN